MSNIDIRALRKKLNRRLNDAFGFQRTSGGKHTTISLSIDECKSVIVALDELDAADKRIAELEALAKSVKFDPIPMEELGNKSDGKKHPYMFGAGYNSAVVHCESVLLQEFAAAGTGKGE
ncbi:hypothetical protein KHR68_004251 [Salmonella enterica subsp. enterica serovar Senftenberg]|nr:hypothetical protein [Salmonella enterica subsp. enterica serovar Senftenberg]EIT4065067.1 hypothetical protein [Salmonella enterica subsp. enterica serovar Senftenberg]